MEEQNFSTLIEFINAMEVREDDEEFKNPVDLMFDALEAEKPNHFAVRQYKKYKLAAGVVCSKRLLNQAVGKSLRTHNPKLKKGAQVMRKNEKITALYERLSRDDFGKDDGLLFCQFLKQQIHRILVFLIVLQHFMVFSISRRVAKFCSSSGAS